jgi:putative ABC transport system substrate-binding protein
MRRREFIAGMGGATVWPVLARAQQAALPVIGHLTVAAESAPSILTADGVGPTAFRKGLGEMGYVLGRNVVGESRWSERLDRLPALASELVRQKVAAIVTNGNGNAALAAKAATATIPIVFVTSSDPVKIGLVASLNRPGANVTGVTNFGGELVAKRLELLRVLVPHATVIGFLLNPANSTSEGDLVDIQGAARSVGQQIVILTASTEDEIDKAFATAAQLHLGALVVDPDSYFNSRRSQLTALAARYAIPASYNTRVFALVGGLMTYGDDRSESYRQLGIYAGRVLKGEKPADLPVVRPNKFELIINLKTAKALGLTVPQALLDAANEVIQ